MELGGGRYVRDLQLRKLFIIKLVAYLLHGIQIEKTLKKFRHLINQYQLIKYLFIINLLYVKNEPGLLHTLCIDNIA